VIRNCLKIIKPIFGFLKTKFAIKSPEKYKKIIDSPIIKREKKLDFSKNRVNKIPVPKQNKRRKRFIPQKTPERVSRTIPVKKVKKNKYHGEK